MSLARWALLWLVAGPVSAQDFAWQWPLQAGPGHEPAYRVALDREVYAVLQDPLLRDVDIVDAQGRRAAAAVDAERVRHYVSNERAAVTWFPLPQAQSNDAQSLRAVIEGQRVVVESATAAPERASGQLQSLLVDLGPAAASTRGLRLLPADEPTPWSLRVRVETSADLSQWRELRPPVQLYQLFHQGHALRQTGFEWSGEPARYLRLHFDVPLAAAAIHAIEAERREAGVSAAPELASVELTGQAGERQGEWLFELPGPMPVRQWSLQLPAAPWVVDAQLESRNGSDRAWVARGGMVAYRLSVDGATLESARQGFDPTRDRYWRLRLRDEVQGSPVLRLDYLPDHLVFTAEAGQQYRLVAGSASARRIDAPVGTVLAAVRSRRGQQWDPPLLALGERAPLQGEAALQPGGGGDRYGRLLLWTILVAVALSLSVFAWRLLGARPPAT